MNIFKVLFLSFGILACGACEDSQKMQTAPGVGPSFGQEQEAGGVDGGGGNAVVCRNQAGEIESAEALDLFEAASMYSLNIQKTSIPMAEQIEKALQVVPASSRLTLATYTSIVQEKMKILPLGTKLEKINDSYEVVLPSRCQVEQLARFYSQDRILVNGEIWAKLGETDRAALVLHEAVYATNRLMGAKDSRRSRHIVAYLFDPSTSWEDVKDGVPENALNCLAMNGKVVLQAFQKSSGHWILNFELLGSAVVVSQKYAFIPQLMDLDFREANFSTIEKGQDKVGRNTKVSTSLHSKFEGADTIVIEKIWESVSGNQAPRYYLTWSSGSFPDLKSEKLLLNCSVRK